ncbi:hypothetical protein ACGFMM_12255 [Streptomyces sp. NPDC048604]|uniref:hypothetical protein n=1 Tax=Streptomyces sp. NPDC048604 TaxID=3365578 RepID=UPI00371387E8
MTRQRDPRETPADAEPDTPAAPAAPLADSLRSALRVGPEAGGRREPRDPREAAAVDAFRRARDSGEHRSRRTRRRDDWRPEAVRRGAATPVRAAGLGVAVAVLLGGVAVAAGAGVIPDPLAPEPTASASRTPRPVDEDPSPGPEGTPDGTPAPEPTPSTGRPGRERPDTAKDEAAHCRTYLAALSRKGKAPNGTAFERLEEAAGGPERVAAYCAPVLDEQDRGPEQDRELDRKRKKQQQ